MTENETTHEYPERRRRFSLPDDVPADVFIKLESHIDREEERDAAYAEKFLVMAKKLEFLEILEKDFRRIYWMTAGAATMVGVFITTLLWIYAQDREAIKHLTQEGVLVQRTLVEHSVTLRELTSNLIRHQVQQDKLEGRMDRAVEEVRRSTK